MINVQMTSPEGVTLATSGKYCSDNVSVTPVLQEKTATPTKERQVLTADNGNVGLSETVVEPIPVQYPDVSNDTVTPETLVEGSTAHDASGALINGTNPYEKTATDMAVNTQAGLIEQIQAALQGKAAGGGGSLLGSVNIADPSGVIPDYYIQGGVVKAYRGRSISSYIPVDPSKLYSVAPFSIIGEGNLKYCEFYDADKQYMRAITAADFATNKIAALSPPSNASFMRLSNETDIIQSCEVYEVYGDVEINVNDID